MPAFIFLSIVGLFGFFAFEPSGPVVREERPNVVVAFMREEGEAGADAWLRPRESVEEARTEAGVLAEEVEVGEMDETVVVEAQVKEREKTIEGTAEVGEENNDAMQEQGIEEGGVAEKKESSEAEVVSAMSPEEAIPVPVLVLDEATSALDSKTEYALQAALREVMRGRTTLIIAHRLSTVMNADNIIVLHKGRIVDQGKHEDLIHRGGLYKQYWEIQAGGYIGAASCQL